MPKVDLDKIEIIERGNKKRKYDFSLIKEVGDYIEIPKSKRFDAQSLCFQYIGRNSLNWKIKLATIEGKYIIVRIE